MHLIRNKIFVKDKLYLIWIYIQIQFKLKIYLLSFDLETNQKNIFQNQIDNQLSESEFINKQSHHIQLLNKKELQIKLTNEDIFTDQIFV